VTEDVRPARSADVDAITAMANGRRNQYWRYQPVFWRPAANAEEVHRPHLAQLVADQNVITLVSEESGTTVGFIIATLADAPPVFDPGGQTCDIDDFVVAPGRWTTTGVRLLRSAIEHAAERGAIQAVVVTAHLDQDKRETLRLCGLSIASEWWVTSLPRRPLTHKPSQRSPTRIGLSRTIQQPRSGNGVFCAAVTGDF
jgi:hypothetical protein